MKVGEYGIPEVNADELSAATLRSAIAHHGSLIVRNLLDQDVVPSLKAAIDEVHNACDNASGVGAYYNPPKNISSFVKPRALANHRAFHRASGSSMCIESPSVAEYLLDVYEQLQLKKLIADYLEEPPCLSARKWVLRRSKLPVQEAGWHQDGAFMGADINTINMWVTLDKCGGDTGAPGMDVIATRLDDIVNDPSAVFDWAVSPESVGNGFQGAPSVSPVFNPGDAMFFDHLFLHRTQYKESFTRLRYAIETWFFGASSFPKNLVPLAW